MTNNEIVVRALANTGITALNEMQQAVLDAGKTWCCSVRQGRARRWLSFCLC